MQTGKDRRLDDDDEENLGYAETYSDYRPAKLRSGLAHPDSVVETASLSSVAPPDVVYQCTMPEDVSCSEHSATFFVDMPHSFSCLSIPSHFSNSYKTFSAY